MKTIYAVRKDKDMYRVVKLVLKGNSNSLRKASILKRGLTYKEATDFANKLSNNP